MGRMEPSARPRRQGSVSSDPSDADESDHVGEATTKSVASTESFEDFYASRWNATVRLALIIGGSASAAEEIAQEAFIRVHGCWDRLDIPDAFLRTVTVNLCKSQLRRRRVAERHAATAQRLDVLPPELDETWSAVCRLPFRQRAVLALRYYADLPEAQIAALLGCRIGTVKSARHRAIETLRKELS